jgi:hypothetical protein
MSVSSSISSSSRSTYLIVPSFLVSLQTLILNLLLFRSHFDRFVVVTESLRFGQRKEKVDSNDDVPLV